MKHKMKYKMELVCGRFLGKGFKVVNKNNSKNFLNWTVVCPYCGKEVIYGETAMISGIVYCPQCAEECRKEVLNDRENNYEKYRTHDYQPYGVKIYEESD